MAQTHDLQKIHDVLNSLWYLLWPGSHLDALWQHFLFILQWYPVCTQIPAPVLLMRGLSHHLPLSASTRACAVCQPAGCSKGEQLFRDGDCGSGRLCTSRGSMESSSELSFCWISCRGTALHMLPFPCCARGQSACSSHCHLPQTPVCHKPGTSSSLSLSLINLPRN